MAGEYEGLDDEDEFPKPPPPAPCADNLPLRAPREVLLDHREAAPAWLTNHTPRFDRDTIDAFLSCRVVYYPASGTDDHAIELFGSSHSAHCFVHCDLGIGAHEVRDELVVDNRQHLRGYRPVFSQELTADQARDVIWLGDDEWEPPRAAGAWPGDCLRGALWAILERENGFDDAHGPARLALLHVRAEAVWLYHELWERRRLAPYAIMVKDYGRDIVWSDFGVKKSPLYMAAERSLPEWLLIASNTNCWPGYCLASDPKFVRGTYLVHKQAHGLSTSSTSMISAPIDWVESVGRLKLPARADRRLQELMDRNAEGKLTEGDREDLEALVELSETVSLIRAEALHLLGRSELPG